jgi:hypothetical protein
VVSSQANFIVEISERSDHLAVKNSVVQSSMDSLDVPEPDVSTRLTLQVIEQSTERDKLFIAPTTPIEAMVELLLVEWRVEMRVQTGHRVETPLAQVAHPACTIKGEIRGIVVYVLVIAPSNLLICDKPVRVEALEHVVNCLSVPLGSLRAGTIFDVMSDATCSDKVSVAKWAHDLSAPMNLRVQVLFVDKTDTN